MKRKLFILILVLSLAACDRDSTQIRDPRTDKNLNIETAKFTIVCDLEKGLGMAYYATFSNSETNVAGMLSPEDYNRFCVTLAETMGKPTISR
jgi:hypothetical protein